MSSETSLRTIFNEALEREDPAARALYLDEACGADLSLRKRVEQLIRAHEEAGGFFSDPAAKPQASALLSIGLDRSLPLTEKVGDRIGHYKLLQQIGEGGCGVVYLADQEEPVRRRVALKIVKLGMDTRQVVARFEAERQALAMMDHPNIARVLDGGATDTGRPYFVMELVRGVKITEYCDHNNLTTRQRLDLFVQVCQAIQHAHQKGIIHRDLKPSNILVTLHDGVPVPKVIDFGIAKATGQQRLTDKTLFTAFEQFIGTPAYMSPEQAEMSGLDVDTRSDIYSLGVLLYELLTGKTPFDTKALLAVGLDEMRRTIREQEPMRPSTKLKQTRAAAAAAGRGSAKSKIQNLKSEIDNDLDWIVMKCLEKDRTRRYETANGLALDIERHLNDEPVLARPPTALYRFQKIVRRNKLTFAAAISVATALILGLAMSTWLLLCERAAHARAEANELLARQNAYAADMNNVQTALARNDLGRARELLDRYRPKPKSEIRDPKSEIDLRGWEWRYFWKLSRGDEQFRLCQYSDLIGALGFSPDGRHLILRGEREGVVAWDFVARKPIARTPAAGSARSLAVSPAGTLVAFTDLGKDGSRLARLWDYVAGRDVALLPLPSGAGWFAFSADGSMLAIVTADGVVQVCEIASQSFVSRLPISKVFFGGSVAMLQFAPDGRWLAISQPGFVLLWDWRSYEQHKIPFASPTAIPTALAWSSDGKYLAAACVGPDASIFIWDLSDWANLAAASQRPSGFQLTGHRERVFSLAFAPDGKTLASAGMDQTVRLWDVENRQEQRCFRGHLHELRGVAFSPNGKQLVSCGLDGAVRVWDPAEPTRPDPCTVLPIRLPLGGCAFASDGRSFIALDRRDGSASLWDTATMQEREKLAFLGTNHAAAAWAADGRTLALGDQGGNLRIWDVSSGRAVTNFVVNGTTVNLIKFSGERTLLALPMPENQPPPRLWTRVVRLWDTTDWREIAVPAEALKELTGAAVSPDARTLVVASAEGSVSWWDLPSGKCEARFENQFARNQAYVRFSHDGRMVAISETKGAITLWDAAARQATAKIHGNLRTVRALAFTPDGRRLLSSGADDEDAVRLLDLSSQRFVAGLPAPVDRYEFVTMSPDETTLVAIGANGTAVFWRAPSWTEIEQIERDGQR